jgi:uncharacterized SAM-dependent methyltransferase
MFVITVTESLLEKKLQESLEKGMLPDWALYIKNAGAQSWLALDRSDDFPIASDLTALLAKSIPSLVSLLHPGSALVSIGPGSGGKERLLLEAGGSEKFRAYYAVDISRELLEIALNNAADIPIEAAGIVAFFEDLPAIRHYWRSPMVVCMLGNNFCNYKPADLFAAIADHCGSQDFFMFDCQLINEESGIASRKAIEKVYRSARNRGFNIAPLLSRGLDEKNCEFALDLITEETRWGAIARTRKTVRFSCEATIRCGDREIVFPAGSTITCGFTYKYTVEQLQAIMDHYGFAPAREWMNTECSNVLVLAQKKRGQSW